MFFCFAKHAQDQHTRPAHAARNWDGRREQLSGARNGNSPGPTPISMRVRSVMAAQSKQRMRNKGCACGFVFGTKHNRRSRTRPAQAVRILDGGREKLDGVRNATRPGPTPLQLRTCSVRFPQSATTLQEQWKESHTGARENSNTAP